MMLDVSDCEQCMGGNCNPMSHQFSLEAIDRLIAESSRPSTPRVPITQQLHDTPHLDLLNRRLTEPCRAFLLNREQLCALGREYGLTGPRALDVTADHGRLIDQLRTAMALSGRVCMDCGGSCSPTRHIVDPQTLSMHQDNELLQTGFPARSSYAASTSSVTLTTASLSTTASGSASSGLPSPLLPGIASLSGHPTSGSVAAHPMSQPAQHSSRMPAASMPGLMSSFPAGYTTVHSGAASGLRTLLAKVS